MSLPVSPPPVDRGPDQARADHAARDRPVRVVLVSTHPVQYAAPLYRRYHEHPGVEVTVVYLSLQGARAGIDPEFGTEVAWDVPLLDGYRWVHAPNRAPRPGLGRFWGLVNPGVWSVIRAAEPDVAVCYGYRAASFWAAIAAARSVGARVVLTTDAHTLVPRDGAGWKPHLKRFVWRVLYGRVADAVWTMSSAGRRMFVSGLGIDPGRVHLTPYVVDVERFREASRSVDVAAVRARWGVPPDALVALFCGKLVPWKRPGDLLESAARTPGVHVVYAGTGPLESDLRRRAGSLDMADRVRFLGFCNQSQLPAVYTSADVLVLPSEHEPFGLVVNEAFACGTPAIVSDACGSAGDLVIDGETGFVVPVGDVDALAERLEMFRSDRNLRARMKNAAGSQIDHWGPTRNVEAFVAACRAIAPPEVPR